MLHNFPYPEFEPVKVPDGNLVPVQRADDVPVKDEMGTLKRAMEQPVGSPRLKDLAQGKKSAVILIDDATRPTPLKMMLPLVLEELASGDLEDEQIEIIVAVGSHRDMTSEEMVEKVGFEIIGRFEISNHAWAYANSLTFLGRVKGELEVWINKRACEAELMIGLGQIAPHRVSGFGGGSKIVLPGICGDRTTETTHWLAANYKTEQIFGRRENPVREAMDSVAAEVGLDFIFNVVLNRQNEVVAAVAGDPMKAHRQGARLSLQVHGVKVPKKADIVIVDSHPADRDFWQAAKALFPAELSVVPGGTIILATTCPEGLSREHPEVERNTYAPFKEVVQAVEKGIYQDLTAAGHVAKVSQVLDLADLRMVSSHIPRETLAGVGLNPADSVQEALDEALHRHGRGASILILEHAGDIFPIVGG